MRLKGQNFGISRPRIALFAMFASAGIAVTSLALALTQSSSQAEYSEPLEWHEWYPGIMEISQKEKRIVLLRYTSDWSATIKINELRLFSNVDVIRRLHELDVLLVKADQTKRSQSIADDLKRYGRVSIPTNIIASSDPESPVIILPELLDVESFLKALDQVEQVSREDLSLSLLIPKL